MTKPSPSDWIFFADSDLALGREALIKQINHLACFHAHQAAEKYLKAALAWKDIAPPKLHSLRELYTLVVPHISVLERHKDHLLVLDQYYLSTRYPDVLPGSLPEGLPSQEQAQQASDAADEIARLIKGVINQPQTPPPARRKL